MAAVAFAENLLIRMPNCARKRPDETPETTPDAVVSAMLATNAPAADSPPAQPAATGSSSVDAAMAMADPVRAGVFASQTAHRLCSMPMRTCVSSSVQMDIRYTVSRTGSPSSPTMFRLWNVMGTHVRKQPSATPVNASVCPSDSRACSFLPSSVRESFPRFVEPSPAPCFGFLQPRSAVRASSLLPASADACAARRLRFFAAAVVFFSPKKNPLPRLKAIIVHPLHSSEPVR